MVKKDKPLTYLVQGSAPEPYVVKVSFSPFSISCTCTAAENHLPCKHRTTILFGADPGITEGDKSMLDAINKAAENAGVFRLLENYGNAKSTEKSANSLSDKAFKKYREARLKFLRKSVKTDRGVISAQKEMDTVIEAIIPAAKKTSAALKALGAVYTPLYGKDTQ